MYDIFKVASMSRIFFVLFTANDDNGYVTYIMWVHVSHDFDYIQGIIQV